MQDDTDFAALDSRLTAAFDRIARGLERMVADPTVTEALQTERDAQAQLAERLRSVKEKAAAEAQAAAARIAALDERLTAQEDEIARLRRTAEALAAQLRQQTEEVAAGNVSPHLVNQAMLTELEALRALRQADAAEMRAILADLAPLVAAAEGTEFEGVTVDA